MIYSFGVKLAVTPTFLSNNRIQLQVDAERTVLSPIIDSPGFAYRLDIAETTVNANVVMNFGDTLILSGLSEKKTSQTRDGVPLLQDIPVIQYFFSKKTTHDYHRSVLILITPRLPVYASTSESSPGEIATIKALKEKLGLPPTFSSNALSILNDLKTSDVFREFRQGDVTIERWDRMQSTASRLKQALEFLYY